MATCSSLPFIYCGTLLILGCVLYAVVIHRATKEQSLADYLGTYRGVLGISTALMLLTLLQDVVTMGFKMPLLYIGSVWAQFIREGISPRTLRLLFLPCSP